MEMDEDRKTQAMQSFYMNSAERFRKELNELKLENDELKNKIGAMEQVCPLCGDKVNSSYTTRQCRYVTRDGHKILKDKRGRNKTHTHIRSFTIYSCSSCRWTYINKIK